MKGGRRSEKGVAPGEGGRGFRRTRKALHRGQNRKHEDGADREGKHAVECKT